MFRHFSLAALAIPVLALMACGSDSSTVDTGSATDDFKAGTCGKAKGNCAWKCQDDEIAGDTGVYTCLGAEYLGAKCCLPATCASYTCGAGTHCELKQIAGGKMANCVADVPSCETSHGNCVPSATDSCAPPSVVGDAKAYSCEGAIGKVCCFGPASNPVGKTCEQVPCDAGYHCEMKKGAAAALSPVCVRNRVTCEQSGGSCVPKNAPDACSSPGSTVGDPSSYDCGGDSGFDCCFGAAANPANASCDGLKCDPQFHCLVQTGPGGTPMRACVPINQADCAQAGGNCVPLAPDACAPPSVVGDATVYSCGASSQCCFGPSTQTAKCAQGKSCKAGDHCKVPAQGFACLSVCDCDEGTYSCRNHCVDTCGEDGPCVGAVESKCTTVGYDAKASTATTRWACTNTCECLADSHSYVCADGQGCGACPLTKPAEGAKCGEPLECIFDEGMPSIAVCTCSTDTWHCL